MTQLPDSERPGPPNLPPGFEAVTRLGWAEMGRGTPHRRPAGGEVVPAAGPVSPRELAEVYEPLGRLLAVVAAAGRAGAQQVIDFLDLGAAPPPFVVGVAGGVAVGKSTVADLLQRLLGVQPGLGPVEVLSTDAFLYSNDELAARGLSARKGFPESYRWPQLVEALAAVKAGADDIAVPVYSHRDYDIVPGECQRIRRPATLIVEGLNVLQVGPGTGDSPGSRNPLVSDFLDWSIYLDAAEGDIARWHRRRLLELHRTGTAQSEGFLGWFCSLSREEAEAVADRAWSGINAVNLRAHIAPTRVRADLILRKDADHRVADVLVRPH